jgi:hypothetical protein
MSYKNLIDKSLTRAFNLVKDLADDATLSVSSGVSFDFATGESETDNVEIVQIKLVFITDEKRSEEHNTISRQAIFKTSVSADLTAYDVITIGTDVWTISQIIKGDGYIRNVLLSKGA